MRRVSPLLGVAALLACPPATARELYSGPVQLSADGFYKTFGAGLRLPEGLGLPEDLGMSAHTVRVGGKLIRGDWLEVEAAWQVEGLVSSLPGVTIGLPDPAEVEVPAANERGARFWEEEAAEVLDQAIPLLQDTARDPTLDALVVDEAQDFTSDHWLLIDALIGAGRLWAFQDPAQAFWPERQVEDSLFDSYFTLSQIYRCHPELMGVAEAVRAGEADDEAVAEAIEAGRLRVVSCPSESSVADKVANEVGKLRGDGLEPGEIAVISLRGLGARESVLHSPALAKHNPVRVEDEALEDHVVADTFLRFKGLERPVIVVTDLHLVTEELGLRMYIALTRALTAAIVVAPGEVLQGNPALSAAR